ncbi:MAG: ribonuclease HII [Candidatus Lokiarchaeota archaeon]|nr:ribonuclease HII [Candidatus Lokiarchaeota archaeon]
MKTIMGIDEAGRGPVLGDLFIGGVVFSDNYLPVLEKSDINDSKKLSPRKREELYDYILQNCTAYLVDQISNEIIDANSRKHVNLNQLELDSISNLIIKLQPDVVYIDALGRDLENFRKKISMKVKDELNFLPKVLACYKADEKYKIVGAASIIAKVHRDRSIIASSTRYKKYGEIGSGYSSDQKTIAFLRNYIKINRKPPEIARTSWQTCANLMNELVYQKKLDGYF